MNKYTMKEAMSVAKQASSDIEKYLRSHPETIEVVNVEDEEFYRLVDIDLVWKNRNGVELIEVKGDRYYRTGNYFFETISNTDKNTLGCFMYSAADFIYYYFIEEKEIHVIPLFETRDWFMREIHNFEDRTVATKVGNDTYQTKGKLVPRELVPNVKIIKVCP